MALMAAASRVYQRHIVHGYLNVLVINAVLALRQDGTCLIVRVHHMLFLLVCQKQYCTQCFPRFMNPSCIG